MSIRFTVEKREGDARRGRILTSHGPIDTPVFMPVGTVGSVKGVPQELLEELGAQVILGNTYHLYLRPGHEQVRKLGGLHRFMSWERAILTDSGGFQVFSLTELRKISEEGVSFRSHLDGSSHLFTPEKSMEIQIALGADIIMAFDECVKNPATYQEARAAMERTHKWLERCLEAHSRPCEQALFGIVQGAVHEDLRRESAAAVTAFDLPGYAIGGVAVGEERPLIEKMVLLTAPLLPEAKPRYLMGVGTPWDIAYAIRCGVDMFDCVLPTRLARHGAAFTGEGRVSLRNARFTEDFQPLEPGCRCFTCRNHTRAYLSHLIRLKEMAGATLLSIHNITYLTEQARASRKAILEGRFREFFESELSLCSRPH